ncbi:histone-lysine N-methyltransferase SETMAR [Trichonephila clavipes]|nr:histone-lysine N-methyltransferase SETMAR [Trichonephila clavipes]
MASDSERALLLRMDGERGTEADMRRNPPKKGDGWVSLHPPGNSQLTVNILMTFSAEIRRLLPSDCDVIRLISQSDHFTDSVNFVFSQSGLPLVSAQTHHQIGDGGSIADPCILDVKDAPRTGRPVIGNVDKITEIIKVDRHVSSRSIAQELKIDHKTVLNHLRKAGFKKKLDVWILHQLTPKNVMDRISICEALAKRNEIDPFLKRMVTGEEKGVTYDNIVRKRSWSKNGEAAQTVAKPGLTTSKVLLCIWWDWKEIIYYELLLYDKILKSDLYCQQLDRLKLAIDQQLRCSVPSG